LFLLLSSLYFVYSFLFFILLCFIFNNFFEYFFSSLLSLYFVYSFFFYCVLFLINFFHRGLSGRTLADCERYVYAVNSGAYVSPSHCSPPCLLFLLYLLSFHYFLSSRYLLSSHYLLASHYLIFSSYSLLSLSAL
jgi:hypothetical protein